MSAFKVVHELHPRFRDTDAMGHINNAAYVTYLEVARQAYWRRLTGGADYRRVPFTLARVAIDFRAEAHVNDILLLAIRCDWIGEKSFAFVYEIRHQESGALLVEAKSVQVCYDYDQKRSRAVPEDLRRTLERFEGRTLARESHRPIGGT